MVLKLHMCEYLRSKFEVSSIILTGFKQGVIVRLSPPQNESLKDPPRLWLIHLLHNSNFTAVFEFHCIMVSGESIFTGRYELPITL